MGQPDLLDVQAVIVELPSADLGNCLFTALEDGVAGVSMVPVIAWSPAFQSLASVIRYSKNLTTANLGCHRPPS